MSWERADRMILHKWRFLSMSDVPSCLSSSISTRKDLLTSGTSILTIDNNRDLSTKTIRLSQRLKLMTSFTCNYINFSFLKYIESPTYHLLENIFTVHWVIIWITIIFIIFRILFKYSHTWKKRKNF